AVLTELLGQRSGSFRFQRTRGRVPDLAGVRLAPFFETGTLDTGELLLVLATAIDKPLPSVPADATPPENAPERRHTRYFPLVIPGSLQLEGSKIEGYLTNLSEGGGFFRGDRLPPDGTNAHLRFALPGNPGVIECRARVAWTRVDPKTGTIGAGLAFSEMGHEGRGRLAAYLARYQRLADECQDAQGEPVAG
ncbi:MAG TPA: PilZ domain-containing protein, partial [Vicinamibacteria bacterium]